MTNRISLNGSDWLFKDFYGEDWRWRGSHLPDSSDRRHWRSGSVPGCPHHDLWKLGEIPDPYVERNSLLREWIPQRTWLYKRIFTVGEEVKGDTPSFAAPKNDLDAPDILILDTNSRLDPPEVAYCKVFAATRELQMVGCRQFQNKTCSVFRGNIGAEFDAMLDAIGLEFAVVVLGFPKNGRTTVDGIHYVHGKKQEDSEFRRDPIHPILRSDLVGILQSQTKRKVALVTHEMVKREAEIANLSAAISRNLRIGRNLIFNSPNNPHALETAHQVGMAHSVLKTEVSRLVSEALAEVTARTPEDTGQNRLVVAGGETSSTVCARLGVDGMRVWKEIQPGLPSCVSLNDPPRMLVLKSGSFGKPDFFEQALKHLKES